MGESSSLPAKSAVDESGAQTPRRAVSLLVVLPAFLVFFVVLFSLLFYFNAVDFGLKLPLVPQRMTPAPDLRPTPRVTQINPDYSPLPLPVRHPAVEGVSLYYRLRATVSEINSLPSGDLALQLEHEGGILPLPFTISATQTVVTKKGESGVGFSPSDIKVGDTLELVYLVDLRSGQASVTQVQVEKGNK
jgi:hypothetical protein